ncbi:MAG: arylsulfatase [Flavobacteriaceae bacterium]|nr:arylsulfatase [Flavobacteriaceae bacterium]
MKIKYALPFLLGLFMLSCQEKEIPNPPNVILIITDDQGYGDLGIHNNPIISTPTLDAFARKSIRFNNFHVSPVCAPTRSSLMTGRYSLRTGVRDTYNGGAIMAASEFTLAEMLKKANYTTGIFGKWHLGDNYPSRPSDQGFDESLIHLAGGIGQVGDFTNYFKMGTSYFDPVLWHNNQQKAYTGYCSDIFTDNAIDFIEKNQEEPFFCYLSFNAPHTPLQVPDKYYQRYKNIDPSEGIDAHLMPEAKLTEKDKVDARKVYAMVSNIDDNLNRLFQKVEALGIEDNTIIIFMTDNGPQQVRYVSGMRGRKSSVYRGGIRVPFFMRYPAKFKDNQEMDQMAAHIDLLPTLSQLCAAPLPQDRKIDGRSFLPALQSETLPERSFFSYWTRKFPELYNNVAIQKGEFKLVGKTDFDASLQEFELYNLVEDPFEKNNLLTQNNEKATSLKAEMDQLISELGTSPNLVNPPLIKVGTPHENPVYLNRNDAGGQRGVWNQEEVYSHWKVDLQKGVYRLKFKFLKPLMGGGEMFLELGQQILKKHNSMTESDLLVWEDVSLPQGSFDFTPFYRKGRRSNYFPLWVEIERVE